MKSLNRYLLLICALAALVFLAACGSAESPDSGKASNSPGATGEQSGAGSSGSDSDAQDGQDSGGTDSSGEDTATAPATGAAPDDPAAAEGAPALPVGGQVGDRAAEIEGITAWLNSEPLTIAELRGKVVLIDFWTYTCINCLRTLPFLKLWNSRYTDDGLVMIGVHSPEFEFEKDLDNVTNASKTEGVVWPVALDNDFKTWSNYSNRFWPAKYLIDKDGIVRYTHFGEGSYEETEEKIRELLKEAGANILEDEFAPSLDQKLDPTFQGATNGEVTREVYAGYERNLPDRLYGGGGYVGQEAYYQAQNEVVPFAKPGDLTPNVLYFHGHWRVGPESIQHGRVTQENEDSINLVYSARSINAVLTSDSGQPYRVRVTVNGDYLTAANKGQDVTLGEDGESYILVDQPRMYNVVESPQWERRNTLQMSSNSKDFGLFAFTFGIYEKQG